ncbi:MAG: GntR family transcriptional regulator [Acidimicrobiales bacterium]
MNATRDTTAGRRGDRPPLAVQAYADLKHRLLVGDFPLGVRLGETALADQLDMSRTPVREALSRLHAEGLVVRHPDGGFSPAAPDLHTISELYEVRRGLEFTALRRGRHDEGQLGVAPRRLGGHGAADRRRRLRTSSTTRRGRPSRSTCGASHRRGSVAS